MAGSVAVGSAVPMALGKAVVVGADGEGQAAEGWAAVMAEEMAAAMEVVRAAGMAVEMVAGMVAG